MIRRLVIIWVIPAVLASALYFAALASRPPSITGAQSVPTVTIAPTTTTTVAGTPATATTVDNCAKCHSEKTTLEELAVKKTEKSEETSGEG